MINFLPSQKAIQQTIIVVLIGFLLFFASWILTVNDSLAGSGSGYGYGYGYGETVRGTIYNDVWTAAESPYIIDGAVTVAYEGNLKIDPGVVVKFKTSTSSLSVYGNITADGTNSQPIVFTSYKDDVYAGDTNGDYGNYKPYPGDWKSIYFDTGSHAVFDEVIIQYGGTDYYSMMEIQSKDVKITNSTLTKSKHMLVVGANALLDGNTITGSGSSKTPIAIDIYNNSPTISNNIISGANIGINIDAKAPFITSNTISNTYYGIVIGQSAMPKITDNYINNNQFGIYTYAGSQAMISNNSIVGNKQYGIYNGTSSNLVMAESNWWGDASGPYHTSNPTGTGNAVSDYVDFSPWLTYDPTIVDTTPPANVTLGKMTSDVWLKSITLNWTNPTDSDFDHVVITRRDAAGNQVVLTETATGTTYTDTAIQYNVPYSYTLVAIDSSGNASNGVTTVKIVVRNPAPTNLTLTPGNKTIQASWTASSAPAATIGGYKIRYGTSPRNLNTQIDVGNVTSTTLTGLTNGTRYYVAVVAYNKAGIESSPSSIKSAVPKR